MSIGEKKGRTHSPTPTAPIRYAGRRPIRSDSAPRAGMAAKWTAEAMSTALSAVCFETSAAVLACTRASAVIT